jgi:hypothetical protein
MVFNHNYNNYKFYEELVKESYVKINQDDLLDIDEEIDEKNLDEINLKENLDEINFKEN